jgi:hypothetical protein
MPDWLCKCPETPCSRELEPTAATGLFLVPGHKKKMSSAKVKKEGPVLRRYRAFPRADWQCRIGQEKANTLVQVCNAPTLYDCEQPNEFL